MRYRCLHGQSRTLCFAFVFQVLIEYKQHLDTFYTLLLLSVFAVSFCDHVRLCFRDRDKVEEREKECVIRG